MIPEYKLYHGAVLCELIDIADVDISIGELKEDGRLSSYSLNQCVGLHIKHSTKRLPPWQFTVTKANLVDLVQLRRRYRSVYIALVCDTDGIVAITVDEAVHMVAESESEQAWLRVSRSRGRWYSVTGNGAEHPIKRSRGIGAIIETLASHKNQAV
jgi:hypothetical protein